MEEGAASEGRRGRAQSWICASPFCAVLLPIICNSLLVTLLLSRAASPSATRNPTFLVRRLILQLKTLAIKKCIRAINECYTPSEPQGNRRWHMTSDVKEVAGKSYDYIIVGGGTCGCPLAATLSEKFYVLLIERGGFCYEW